jgi:hypothetical protein
MQDQTDRPESLVLAHADDDPPVFYGPPAALHGSLRLTNPTDQKQKLVRLPLSAPGLAGLARAPAGELLLGARLQPGEQEAAGATIALDPRTPPGTYQAETNLGGRCQQIILHVVEVVDLRIQPDVIYLFTEGERRFTRRFVVENAGNVPVRLGGRCAAMLVDVIEERAALRDSGARACEDPQSDALRELLCAWSRQQVGLAFLDRPDETIEPGEVRAGEATITLPDGLRPHRRYEARLELYNAGVLLDVTTGHLTRSGPDQQEPQKGES